VKRMRDLRLARILLFRHIEAVEVVVKVDGDSDDDVDDDEEDVFEEFDDVLDDTECAIVLDDCLFITSKC
jgi:hypothetical protein